MKFHADPELCVRCGICARGCVREIIAMPEEGVPFVDLALGKPCNGCGHCAALCPTGAVSLDGKPSSSLALVGSRLPSEDAARMVMSRRSIRKFKPEPPDCATLEKVIGIACYAPTSSNKRDVGYTVMHGREKVERLNAAFVPHLEKQGLFPAHTAVARTGKDIFFRGAPCLVLIHGLERELMEADCASAAAYLELLFPSFGLGSCWDGFLVTGCRAGLPEGLVLPEGHRLHAALMVGRPDIVYRRIPERTAQVDWL